MYLKSYSFYFGLDVSMEMKIDLDLKFESYVFFLETLIRDVWNNYSFFLFTNHIHVLYW